LWREAETLDSFLKRIKCKEGNTILLYVFENGRTNKDFLFKKFESEKSKIQELVKKSILKSSEVKDMLIIDVNRILDLS